MGEGIVYIAALLLSASACLGQERSLGDAQGLQAELTAWGRASQESTFRGVVEFEKVLQLPADPSKLEHVAVFEGDVVNPGVLGRMQQLSLEWGVNGIEVVQAWRVALADEDQVRVETSVRHRRPEDPVAEPMVSIIASDGRFVWEWDSVSHAIVHNASMNAHTIDQDMLGCGVAELQRLLNYNPLDGAQVLNVRQDKGTVVAEIRCRSGKAAESMRTSQLTFMRDARGLLLTNRVTVCPGRQLYWVSTFSDHRDLGDRRIPYERTVRSGPLEELDTAERPLSRVTTYRIRKVTVVASPQPVASFGLPEGALQDILGSRQYAYRDISGPWTAPFRPER